jgi:SAM-dependent methyltransferase
LQLEGNFLLCPTDAIRYDYDAGIPSLLDPERAEELRPFIIAYQQQRAEEGWATPQPDEYYLNLPYRDVTGRHKDLWQLRQRHMERLFDVLKPVLDTPGATILDAGAGNCWLSYRLWERGACPIAIDLNTAGADGLGAAEIYRKHKGAQITVAQAELERLPLAGGSCDAAIINGSLHYTASPATALSEALRILRPGGMLVVMDSPVYHSDDAGQKMRKEFIRNYIEQTGKEPSPIPGDGYLTFDRMSKAFQDLRVPQSSVTLYSQHTGLRALARRAKLALSPPRRELATHPMWVVSRDK